MISAGIIMMAMGLALVVLAILQILQHKQKNNLLFTIYLISSVGLITLGILILKQII